ncbi:RNA-binding protein Msa1 [Schizosaccharomyces osmophilus]|uniref:RNA-binding protein Msa1 n=1 Tax=Schizosaccharomyces osmophilus TaxID=2545709 RepID=A0AAE9WCV0_9SCHI|nr:RNA-binding protein Msa1 [Schizosaccharomyces osmophilus]WBW73513.1 RNA-binding protein Msa1 [Schizosaccharomyces osmophilus]
MDSSSSSPSPSPSPSLSPKANSNSPAVSPHSTESTTAHTNLPNQRGKPIACLFVGSLNSSLSESQLTVSVKNYFQKWGPLLHVKVLKDWLQRSYSFVQFASVDDASTALKEAQNALLDDRRIRIERAKVNRTIYLAHPSHLSNFSFSDIHQLLEPYGLIEELVKTKDSSGYLVRFVYRDDAISAFVSLRNSPYKVVWAENVSTKSVFRKKIPNSSFHNPPHGRPSKSSSSRSSSFVAQSSQRNPLTLKSFHNHSAPLSSNLPSLAPSTPISPSLATPTSATKYDDSSDMSTPNKSISSSYTSPYSHSKFTNKSPTISNPSLPSPKFPPSYLPSTHPYCQPLMPFVDPFSIFVDHLDSKSCTQNSLAELFSEYGNVLDCKFIRQSNKPAFAFLQFDSQQAAFNAVYHKPQPFFQKKPLRVKFRVLPRSAYPVSSYQYPMVPPSFLPSSNAIFPTVNSANHSSMPYPCHPSMASLSPPTTFGFQPDIMQPIYPFYPYPDFCYTPGNLYYYGASPPSHTVGSD